MLAMVAAQATGQNLVLADDMSSPSYSSNFFTSFSNPDDVSFAGFIFSGSGGNPGESLIVEHYHDVDRDEFDQPINGDGETFLQSYFTEQSVSYTPSTSGQIASLTFSVDYRTTDPFTTIFFDVSDLNGGNSAGFTSLTTDGNWHTLSVSGLTQADFSGRDFSGSDPLSFGFGALSSYDATFDATTFAMDVDNFTVTVNPVPEPTSALLAGLGAAALLLRRRVR